MNRKEKIYDNFLILLFTYKIQKYMLDTQKDIIFNQKLQIISRTTFGFKNVFRKL